ncbi:MAG: AAA family ATPase, partial [Actinomycetota bacterium]|nr:AAA family ATPase [Actinomycetota bacterium]
MAGRSALVGRGAERDWLGEALERARLGHGSLVLVAGEAGVGKTRLIEEVASGSDALVLWGRAAHGPASPYGPVVAALRAYMRARPDGFAELGPLRPHLALILPELGDAAPAGDRATLFEAIRCALAELAAAGPVLMVLDDLQSSDEATLELLPALAEPLGELSLLLVGAYRSDGLPRDHLVRRVRHELRRGGRLEELTVGPLDATETAELLTQVLGEEPAPALANAVHDRTQGVSFFVEELARALLVTGGEELPIPDTVRDAVLIAASELSPEARAAAEAAAVGGEAFDLDLIAELGGALDACAEDAA